LTQLANAESVPAEGIPLALGVVQNPKGQLSSTLANAIIVLTKPDSADRRVARLFVLLPTQLKKMPHSGKDYESALNAFLASPKLENHHLLVEQLAEKRDGQTARYADVALLSLSGPHRREPGVAASCRRRLSTPAGLRPRDASRSFKPSP